MEKSSVGRRQKQKFVAQALSLSDFNLALMAREAKQLIGDCRVYNAPGLHGVLLEQLSKSVKVPVEMQTNTHTHTRAVF